MEARSIDVDKAKANAKVPPSNWTSHGSKSGIAGQF